MLSTRRYYYGLIVLFLISIMVVSCTLPDESLTTSQSIEPTNTTVPATQSPTAIATALPEPTSAAQPTQAPLTTEHQTVLFVDGQGLDTYFNQAAWDAVLAVGDQYGMLVELVAWEDIDTVGAKITEMIESGYTIVITNGFKFTEITVEYAERYPAVLFIGLDQFESPTSLDNLLTVYFDVWDSGFKAGALAAMLTESGLVWGAHGPADNPVVLSYGEGFAAGVAYIDPDIEIVSYYYDGDGFPYDDPEWGQAQAERAVQEGADVLFSAAGITSMVMMETFADSEGGYCIGVDIDQWNDHPELHSCLVSSAIKRLDTTLQKVLGYAVEDKFISGTYKGEGGLAPFHDFDDVITDEIRSRLNEIQMMMYTGEIQP